MELVVAKIISLAAVFIVTLISGTLPYCLVLVNTGRFLASRKKKVVRYLNCFSGGVFLGALFLDLLPEGSEEFDKYKEAVHYDSEYPFYNTMIIFGFFVTASIEHFAHSVLAPRMQSSATVTCTHSHSNERKETEHFRDGKAKGYGTMTSESKTALQSDQVSHIASIETVSDTGNGVHHTGAGYNVCDNEDDRDFVATLVSIKSTSRSGTDNVRSIVLLIALSFHSIFDGLAFGLQETTSQVWQIFVAVALHKCVVASCLGLDVYMNFSDTRIATLMMVVFALISPIGAAIGISVTSSNINETAQLLSSGILQALSCGAFLYVTFLEILNTYWKDGHCRRSYFDIICSFIGVTIMALVKILD